MFTLSVSHNSSPTIQITLCGEQISCGTKDGTFGRKKENFLAKGENMGYQCYIINSMFSIATLLKVI